MKNKRILFSAFAVLALAALIFGGCNTGLTDADTQAGSAWARNASFSVQDPNPSGTTWLLNSLGTLGVSKIVFDTTSTATGNFGATTHGFTFTYDTGTNEGVLIETTTLYRWEFVIRGNLLIFTGGFAPYDTNPTTTFAKILFPAPYTLEYLTGTNWLGIGPRGLSLMDTVVENPDGTGSLIGRFGPDQPNPFNFTYSYEPKDETGTGNLDGAGDFTTSDAYATMLFPDFWGHGVQVTFNLFTYAP
jgi:hypothetical protein